MISRALIVLAVLGALPHAHPAAASDLGQAAPVLAVTELDGQPFDLTAQRGKVVIVNFWATWCPPCRTEMPALNAIYQRYHARGVELIGVSADRPRDRAAAVRMMRTYSYPAAMMADAKVNGFGPPRTLPETFVVGPDGVIRGIFQSDQKVVTEESLSAVVLPLLAPAR